MATPTLADQRRLYRITSLALSVVFALVGLLFLFVPAQVIVFFNTVSVSLGMAEAPVEGSGFYLILAVGYMYVVTVLAVLMFRNPGNGKLMLVLINAKSASSVLSFGFFVAVHSYVIFFANGVVDGAIACGLLFLRANTKGLQ